MPDRMRRRAGPARIEARRRAAFLAGRLGIGAKGARLSAALRQTDVSRQAGISQSFLSRIERGHGQQASLETWASVAAATGHQLAAFIERVPGTTLPRDYEHLKRQQLVITTARSGGWTATVEQAIDADWERPRSIDVVLTRGSRGEVAVVEIWNLVDDVGAAFRGLDAKVARIRRERGATTSALMVIRGTRRNRTLVREFRSLFRAQFPASSASWLAALIAPDKPMPVTLGLVWTDVAGTRMLVARL
jgi:transcriptional regulator with XRE-family HTH domain